MSNTFFQIATRFQLLSQYVKRSATLPHVRFIWARSIDMNRPITLNASHLSPCSAQKIEVGLAARVHPRLRPRFLPFSAVRTLLHISTLPTDELCCLSSLPLQSTIQGLFLTSTWPKCLWTTTDVLTVRTLLSMPQNTTTSLPRSPSCSWLSTGRPSTCKCPMRRFLHTFPK